jgi:putative DNA primase/helicase
MRSELNDKHREDLRSSGLSDETIELSGIRSITQEEAKDLLGFDPGCGGWEVPYPGTEDSNGRPFRRFKPDVPFQPKDGKPAKYLSPSKEKYPLGNRLYIPPNLDPAALKDAGSLLVITEGEKKALKACQEGVPTVALSGVSCWVAKDDEGGSHPIADLDLIAWSCRKTLIVFDSDVVRKEEVQWEEYKLYRELLPRGATCRAARLPEPTAEEDDKYGLGGKLGLDDFFVVRGPGAFKAVVKNARAPRKPSRAGKDDDKKLQHYRVARDYLRDKGLHEDDDLRLRHWRGTFHRWTGRAYREWPDHDVRASVMRYIQSRRDLQGRCTRHFVSNVIGNLEGICGLDSGTTPPTWVCDGVPCDATRCVILDNGILDVDALMAGADEVLLPHSPSLFALNALPFEFDPDAGCALWEKTLGRILPDPAARALLQEWYGYCLLPGSWLQKFVVMLGEGANGKSVVCKTLANLLGQDNISAVPIERFRETHNLVGTLGKLANISAEFETINRAEEGSLKSFVTADPMEFNPKYKPTYTARPTARLIVATNNLPVIRDKSSGPFRRMVVLEFPVQIPEAEQDPQLVEKLAEELPGILNWALVGLFRLLERGRLAEPESSAALREEYRRNCNPARMFIEENLRFVPTTHLPKQAVYDEYKGFCKDGGYMTLNEAHFAREVYRYFGKNVRPQRIRTEAGRSQVYDGLAWSGDGADDGGQSGQRGQSKDKQVSRSDEVEWAAGGQGGQGGQGPLTRIPKGKT